jgi:hypothetical protein
VTDFLIFGKGNPARSKKFRFSGSKKSTVWHRAFSAFFGFAPASAFDAVSINALGEAAYASPALSEGQIFLRSNGHLWCVGERRRGDGIVKIR